jgi:hypothetical protein
MDHSPAPVAVPQKTTPITFTTRRAIATSAMTLGIWSVLVFWWYPFGLFMGITATALAMLSIAMGWRAGKEGQHLAWFGLLFGGSGAGMAFTSYRVMQLVFEGSLPLNPIPI